MSQIKHPHRCILASAGTGKTYAMVQAYLDLVKQGVSSNEILVLTFSEKATGELKERIHSSINCNSVEIDPQEKQHISTLHQFCFQLISEKQSEKNLSILNELNQQGLLIESIQKVIKQKLQNDHLNNIELQKFFKNYGLNGSLRIIQSALLDNNLEFNKNPSILEQLIQECSEKYIQRCQEKECIDFNQMEEQAYDLLKTSEQIKTYYQNYRYIFVDEFQDTSPKQLRILKQIYENIKKEHSCSFLIVGDFKQSIYQFRGVKSKFIHSFLENLKKDGLEIKNQNINYRSGDRIVNFSNLFTQKHFESEAQVTHHQEIANNRVWVTELEHESATSKLSVATQRQIEAQYISQEIKKLLEHSSEKISIAILYRSSTGIEQLTHALEESDIQYQIRGGQNLLTDQSSIDIIQLLKFISYTEANNSLLGILKSPLFGLSDDALTALSIPKGFSWSRFMEADQNLCRNLSLEDEWPLIQRAQNKLSQLIEIQSQVCLKDLFAILESELALFEIHDYLDKKLNPNYLQLKYTFIELQKNLESYDLKALIKYYENIYKQGSKLNPVSSQSDTQNSEKQSIEILTIHAAKGLEFDYVFCFDSNQSGKTIRDPFIIHDNQIILKEDFLFEEVKKNYQQDQIEEEKRIFYVMLTRAKKQLEIIRLAGQKTKAHSLLDCIDQMLNKNSENYSRKIKLVNSKKEPEERIKEKIQQKTHNKANFAKVPKQYKRQFSVSEIDTYQESEEQYLRQYIYNIKNTEKDSQQNSTDLGMQVHFYLENYKKNFNKIQQAELEIPGLASYIESKQFLEIKEAALDYAELAFTLQLGRYSIRGQIDRIIEAKKNDKNGMEVTKIIDFKYAKYKPEHLSKYEFQLKTYVLAAQKLGLENTYRAELHYIIDNKVLGFDYNDDILLEHEKNLIQIVSNIYYQNWHQNWQQDFKDLDKPPRLP